MPIGLERASKNIFKGSYSTLKKYHTYMVITLTVYFSCHFSAFVFHVHNSFAGIMAVSRLSLAFSETLHTTKHVAHVCLFITIVILFEVGALGLWGDPPASASYPPLVTLLFQVTRLLPLLALPQVRVACSFFAEWKPFCLLYFKTMTGWWSGFVMIFFVCKCTWKWWCWHNFWKTVRYWC